MSTRSVLLKLVLLAVVLCCSAWPSAPAHAGGFAAPHVASEPATSWVGPMLDWLGWDGLEALFGLGETTGAEAPEGVSTSGLDTSSATDDEEDDRGTVIDPNG